MKMMEPFSMPGRKEFCSALLKRWISLTKRMVWQWDRSRRASSMTDRTSLTPAVTAETCGIQGRFQVFTLKLLLSWMTNRLTMNVFV
ncbi:hypothetical protein J5N97_024391 [Dioscorea zingiberensis]|uniref:Uncharacterized protein n=1 Tax=Dioscorea zingiberensis TaxID=325984 RepID=A0A9D5H8R6_9LILI|nr:hypothetical protein J5N97_024391 [Dioscorea zingiberensis]